MLEAEITRKSGAPSTHGVHAQSRHTHTWSRRNVNATDEFVWSTHGVRHSTVFQNYCNSILEFVWFSFNGSELFQNSQQFRSNLKNISMLVTILADLASQASIAGRRALMTLHVTILCLSIASGFSNLLP